MKKIVLFSILVISLSIIVFPDVLAQPITAGEIPTAGNLGVPVSPVSTLDEILEIIQDIVRWIYIIFFIIAVAEIIFAAFTYLGAGENPDNAVKARKMIIYAAIAVAVALLAVSFELIVGSILVGRGSPPLEI